MGMTIGDLKKYLENFDDRAKIYYFDSEAGEEAPFNSSWLGITDDYGELKVVEDGMTIEEHIEQLKKLKSFHNGSYGASINFALDTMRKYQKIVELYDYWRSGKCEYTISCMENIGKVLKDGNDNR